MFIDGDAPAWKMGDLGLSQIHLTGWPGVQGFLKAKRVNERRSF